MPSDSECSLEKGWSPLSKCILSTNEEGSGQVVLPFEGSFVLDLEVSWFDLYSTLYISVGFVTIHLVSAAQFYLLVSKDLKKILQECVIDSIDKKGKRWDRGI